MHFLPLRALFLLSLCSFGSAISGCLENSCYYAVSGNPAVETAHEQDCSIFMRTTIKPTLTQIVHASAVTTIVTLTNNHNETLTVRETSTYSTRTIDETFTVGTVLAVQTTTASTDVLTQTITSATTLTDVSITVNTIYAFQSTALLNITTGTTNIFINGKRQLPTGMPAYAESDCQNDPNAYRSACECLGVQMLTVIDCPDTVTVTRPIAVSTQYHTISQQQNRTITAWQSVLENRTSTYHVTATTTSIYDAAYTVTRVDQADITETESLTIPFTTTVTDPVTTVVVTVPTYTGFNNENTEPGNGECGCAYQVTSGYRIVGVGWDTQQKVSSFEACENLCDQYTGTWSFSFQRSSQICQLFGNNYNPSFTPSNIDYDLGWDSGYRVEGSPCSNFECDQ